MNDDQAKKYIDYLNKNKHLVGFTEYKIKLKKKIPRRENPVAETSVDRYEKELVVELSTAFMKLDDVRKRNVLIHELIHARFELQTQRIEDSIKQIKYEFEEEYVNDITTGMMERLEKEGW